MKESFSLFIQHVDKFKKIWLFSATALSNAALFLTTEAVIADRPEKAAPMAGGGDMGGMDF